MTVRGLLDYVAILKGITDRAQRQSQVDSMLETVALTAEADRRIGGFSGGMLRRAGIAQALLNDPAVLIVDEPTAGLDPEERLRFRNILAHLAGDRTILLSTHIVEDIAATCSLGTTCREATGADRTDGDFRAFNQHCLVRMLWREAHNAEASVTPSSLDLLFRGSEGYRSDLANCGTTRTPASRANWGGRDTTGEPGATSLRASDRSRPRPRGARRNQVG